MDSIDALVIGAKVFIVILFMLWALSRASLSDLKKETEARVQLAGELKERLVKLEEE